MQTEGINPGIKQAKKIFHLKLKKVKSKGSSTKHFLRII